MAAAAVSPASLPEMQAFTIPPPVKGLMRRAASPTSISPEATVFDNGLDVETPPATISNAWPLASPGCRAISDREMPWFVRVHAVATPECQCRHWQSRDLWEISRYTRRERRIRRRSRIAGSHSILHNLYWNADIISPGARTVSRPAQRPTCDSNPSAAIVILARISTSSPSIWRPRRRRRHFAQSRRRHMF